MNGNKQIRKGIALSYSTIVVNSLSNILLTPGLIATVGQSNYGVYQTIYAFAANLVVIDIGTGTMMTRFLSIYLADKNEKEVNNYSALGIVLSSICAIVALFAGAIMFLYIDSIYGSKFTPAEMQEAKVLFVLMILNVAISMMDKAFLGIINAHERFTVSKSTVLLKILFRIVAIITIIVLKGSVVWISIAELTASVVTIIAMIGYIMIRLHVHPHLYHIDKNLIIASSTFMAAIVFNNIVNQINLSLDKILIGAIVSTTAVTIYQVGLIIVNANNQIANSASNIFLPKITKSIYSGSDMDEIVKIAVKPGRLNYIITGMILIEFMLFGKEFLSIWMKSNGYEQSYWIVIMLFVAYLIPHIEIATGSILDAMNKRMVRSVILAGIAIINGIGTALILPYYGILGAAFMTMITVLIGQGVILNIYFQRFLHVDIKKMLLLISRGITPCLCVSAIVGFPLVFLKIGVIGFILKCSIVLFTFVFLMIKIGFNKEEKIMIANVLVRIKSLVKR